MFLRWCGLCCCNSSFAPLQFCDCSSIWVQSHRSRYPAPLSSRKLHHGSHRWRAPRTHLLKWSTVCRHAHSAWWRHPPGHTSAAPSSRRGCSQAIYHSWTCHWLQLRSGRWIRWPDAWDSVRCSRWKVSAPFGFLDSIGCTEGSRRPWIGARVAIWCLTWLCWLCRVSSGMRLSCDWGPGSVRPCYPKC